MGESVFLLEHLIAASAGDRTFKILVEACNEQQAFALKIPENTRDIISNVNSRLNKLEHRISGIHILKPLLLQCSDKMFVENSFSWLTQCLKAVSNFQSEKDAYEVLCLLLDMSHNFQELTKQISGKIIPKLLDHILKNGHSVAALQCLEVVLHYYSGPCKIKASKVQKLLLQVLDEEERGLVDCASRCMCYLPLLLTTGHDNGSSWTQVFTELCATASTLMYELYEGVHEIATPSVLAELSQGYKLKSLKMDNPIVAQHQIANRLVNLFTFIEAMLLGELRQVKAVRADFLVALAYRALAVNCKMVSQGRSMDHIALACVLPQVHVAVLSLLQTYVSCCPVGLLKYGPLFCKLVLQTLKWTSGSNGIGVERPYSRLREAAYNFLEIWVLRAKAGSCVELLAEELINLILPDVHQKKESFTLQFQAKGTSSAQLPQVREQLAEVKLNAVPCEAALRVLSAIVLTSGALLGPSVHMRLQEVVVTLLLELQRASGPMALPAPYAASGCREQLHRLLLALTLHPHPRWPPPTQFALVAFPHGQHDIALQVSRFCTLALACTRQMVHPSQSSHQFPISLDEMRTAVGLPNLQPVEGIKLNFQDEENEVESDDIEMEYQESTISGAEKSQQSPLFNDNLPGKTVFNSSATEKLSKRRNSTPMTGIESSINTSSPGASKKKRCLANEEVPDKDEENSPKSDKPLKKKRYLQFTVEELIPANERITRCNSGQAWEVSEIIVKPKENGEKSIEGNETSETTKHCDSPSVDLDKQVIRQVGESPSKQCSLKGLDLANKPGSKPSVSSQRQSNNGSDVGNNDVGSIEENSEKDEALKEGETNNDSQSKMKSKNESNKEVGDVKERDQTSVDEEKNEIDKKEEELTERYKTDIVSEKNSPPPKTETYRYNLRKHEVNTPTKTSFAASLKAKECQKNDQKSLTSPIKSYQSATNTTEKSSVIQSPSGKTSEEGKVPKVASPIVEIVVSSDSEPDQQKKTSGCFRRITRSLTKRVSTPYKGLGQGIEIEELPASQDSFTSEMLSEISRLEKESAVNAEDPCVELADSDNSCDMVVLRVDSDDESVEIECGTSDTKVVAANSGKQEETTLQGYRKSLVSKELRDSLGSDREIEDNSEGMRAVTQSPDVAVEETQSSTEKDDSAKKLRAEGKSGSETDEESILKTFVDVVSPKSA